jgi:adenylate kinase family enzyme
VRRAARVAVIGVTGTGKTTFAAALARKLGVPHIELDALHWEPNWVMAELDVFRERVERAVAADRWVVDGNYSKTRDLVWSRADTVVWLDYAFALTFARLLRRTLARVISGEELWNGNRERFADQFLSRDSVFLWAIQTYPRYRATFPKLLASDAYAHLRGDPPPHAARRGAMAPHAVTFASDSGLVAPRQN